MVTGVGSLQCRGEAKGRGGDGEEPPGACSGRSSSPPARPGDAGRHVPMSTRRSPRRRVSKEDELPPLYSPPPLLASSPSLPTSPSLAASPAGAAVRRLLDDAKACRHAFEEGLQAVPVGFSAHRQARFETTRPGTERHSTKGNALSRQCTGAAPKRDQPSWSQPARERPTGLCRRVGARHRGCFLGAGYVSLGAADIAPPAAPREAGRRIPQRGVSHTGSGSHTTERVARAGYLQEGFRFGPGLPPAKAPWRRGGRGGRGGRRRRRRGRRRDPGRRARLPGTDLRMRVIWRWWRGLRQQLRKGLVGWWCFSVVF